MDSIDQSINRFTYHLYRKILTYLVGWCQRFLINLSDEDRERLFNNEEKIDYQCQQIKQKNCKHKLMILCSKCGKEFKINKEKNEDNKDSIG